MKETYPLHKNSKKGSFGFSFCFLKIFRFYRYQANMKKGAKIKMSEIQLRRKMNTRTNASSKRDPYRIQEVLDNSRIMRLQTEQKIIF